MTSTGGLALCGGRLIVKVDARARAAVAAGRRAAPPWRCRCPAGARATFTAQLAAGAAGGHEPLGRARGLRRRPTPGRRRSACRRRRARPSRRAAAWCPWSPSRSPGFVRLTFGAFGPARRARPSRRWRRPRGRAARCTSIKSAWRGTGVRVIIRDEGEPLAARRIQLVPLIRRYIRRFRVRQRQPPPKGRVRSLGSLQSVEAVIRGGAPSQNPVIPMVRSKKPVRLGLAAALAPRRRGGGDRPLQLR